MQRIIVSGFPHSGTTILRKLIGNHPAVYDYSVKERRIYNDEFIQTLPISPSHTHIVIKTPFYVPPTDPTIKYVYIIKNPLDVFGSLKLRFDPPIDAFGTLEDIQQTDEKKISWKKWLVYAKQFIQFQQNTPKNVFIVEYKSLFPNKYAKIKEMIAWLNLKWDPCIIETDNKQTIMHGAAAMQCEPTRNHHTDFRNWQNNQKFTDMSGKSRQSLSARAINIIQRHYLFKELFEN